MEKRFCKLARHVENMKSYSRPVCIINRAFNTDNDSEIALLKRLRQLLELSVRFEGFAGWGVMVLKRS